MSIIHRIARALGIVLARARHRGIPKRLFDAPRDAARDPRDEKVVCPTDRRVDVPHTDARAHRRSRCHRRYRCAASPRSPTREAPRPFARDAVKHSTDAFEDE